MEIQKLLYLTPRGKEMVFPLLVDWIQSISETGRAVATESCGVKREGVWGKDALMIKCFSWYWIFLQLVFSCGYLLHSKIFLGYFLATKTTSTSSQGRPKLWYASLSQPGERFHPLHSQISKSGEIAVHLPHWFFPLPAWLTRRHWVIICSGVLSEL